MDAMFIVRSWDGKKTAIAFDALLNFRISRQTYRARTFSRLQINDCAC